MNIKDFKENLQQEIFGSTPKDCCIQCKQPFTYKNVHTQAGWKETKISQLCEDCFDSLFPTIEY